jgi:Ser/Thr protein kinase RdoA (MazF antagonist)
VEYVERLLDAFAALPDDDPRAMPTEQRTAVRAHLPVLERWVEQVAALGLPTTLCHNDLHGNNVFDLDGELRFFDFGDALLMEPLAALTLPLATLADRLGTGPDDPGLWRVADAALEVWGDLVPVAELRAALPAALQLGRLGRVETWVRCLAPMDDAELVEWGSAAGVSLASLLEPPPLGHLGG